MQNIPSEFERKARPTECGKYSTSTKTSTKDPTIVKGVQLIKNYQKTLGSLGIIWLMMYAYIIYDYLLSPLLEPLTRDFYNSWHLVHMYSYPKNSVTACDTPLVHKLVFLTLVVPFALNELGPTKINQIQQMK